MIEDLTFVVIGRNESLNLPRCFSSIKKISNKIIFVDSNSSDNSIEIAKKYDIETILKVDSNHGSPALSRSVGANRVKTKYIQFLDGDMSLDENWISLAIIKIKSNKKIAAVHGFKKVYTKNQDEFFILSDKKDWQADYLQGAFLIERRIYKKSGGLDSRFYGEEERDLYIRIKSIGYEVWYIHHLMSSHYDLKKKSFKKTYFSEICAMIWLPLLKSIKKINFVAYLFVYRLTLPSLIIDTISIFFLVLGLQKYLVIVILIQMIEMIFCFLIKRKGYFIIWKVAFLNFPRVFPIYFRKIKHSVSEL